jgi:very-short-patch-repair endonuclease
MVPATANLRPLADFLPAVLELAAAAFAIRPSCESPIEVMLGARLTVALRKIEGAQLSLSHQYPLRRYRYDFAISGEEKLIALIECDGKAFHSTEAQIANDRAKDKLAAEKGVPIFRFSGSEIFENEKECVLLILYDLRGHLTEEQLQIVWNYLAPRPWYKGDDQFKANEDDRFEANEGNEFEPNESRASYSPLTRRLISESMERARRAWRERPARPVTSTSYAIDSFRSGSPRPWEPCDNRDVA